MNSVAKQFRRQCSEMGRRAYLGRRATPRRWLLDTLSANTPIPKGQKAKLRTGREFTVRTEGTWFQDADGFAVRKSQSKAKSAEPAPKKKPEHEYVAKDRVRGDTQAGYVNATYEDLVVAASKPGADFVQIRRRFEDLIDEMKPNQFVNLVELRGYDPTKMTRPEMRNLLLDDLTWLRWIGKFEAVAQYYEADGEPLPDIEAARLTEEAGLSDVGLMRVAMDRPATAIAAAEAVKGSPLSRKERRVAAQAAAKIVGKLPDNPKYKDVYKAAKSVAGWLKRNIGSPVVGVIGKLYKWLHGQPIRKLVTTPMRLLGGLTATVGIAAALLGGLGLAGVGVVGSWPPIVAGGAIASGLVAALLGRDLHDSAKYFEDLGKKKADGG